MHPSTAVLPALERKRIRDPMPRRNAEPELEPVRIPERKERNDWLATVDLYPGQWLSGEEQIAEQMRQAALVLRECVEVTARKLGGVPVLKGTRFPIAQVLSQIADGDSVEDLAENFELDRDQLRSVLHALAAFLDRPILR